ncbi:sugar ABC transporter ATP-binding protein [Candidatus Atribacteria bacterium HGW-Atribacteria-1]|nr:MAG: sugar ABC transporter ATP-binding protein [Candidatus Atribacteria bacterium HGW-Atribacteria-1]
MTDLIIKNLSKKYRETIAVENLNLKVKDKEFVVLVGPSGCGKTTVLNSIAGLIEIDKGEIWFGDELVTSPRDDIFKIPQKREVAMVFQDYAIYPHMSVFGNIAFPLEIRKIGKFEIEERVKKIAQLLKIDHLLERKPKELSGGQRQRIALGRAMVRGPKLFLMDEPLANLDAKLRVHARVELKKLQQELGVTTIFVTHDQVEAMTIGDKIAVMNNGYLEQMGMPTELYHNPRNKFVAEFIGSPPMNMVDGSLVEKNGNIEIDLGISSIYRLSKKMKELVKRTTPLEISLGVRPENITIIEKNQPNSLKAKIVYIELVGKEFNVHLEVGGESLIAIRSFVEDLKVGDEVWLSFDEEKIHIFDRESSKALF